MGKLVYIMGKSGTGKSRSMKNIPADEFGLINLEGKDLPFGKDALAFKVERVVYDRSDDIVEQIKEYSKRFKIIIVDDFQTLMTNEYMRRSQEGGFQKFTDIGRHAWDVAQVVKEIPDDVIVYVLCHTEENDNGGEKIKTIGKLLDEKVVLESKATIVLKTGVEDGKYFFCTQNNGKDTVKSPEGMFPSYAIQNDLKYVDDTIRNYYDLPGAKSDAEMAKEHTELAQEDVKPSTGRKSRKKEEKPAEVTEKIPFSEEVQEKLDAVLGPDPKTAEPEEVPKRERTERTAGERAFEKAKEEAETRTRRRRTRG